MPGLQSAPWAGHHQQHNRNGAHQPTIQLSIIVRKQQRGHTLQRGQSPARLIRRSRHWIDFGNADYCRQLRLSRDRD